MVQRSDTGSLTPSFEAAKPTRRRTGARAAERGGRTEAGTAAPARKGLVALNSALLALFFVSLMIPGTFNVAGVTLTPSRLLLLVGFVPLGYSWLRGDAGRITGVDILFFLTCLWIWISLTVNHGLSFVPRAGIFFIELFGGYLYGRVLIRNAADYRMFFRYFLFSLIFLMPFVVIESLTRRNILREVFDMVLSIPPRQENLRRRLGLIRAQGPFDHPILLGIYCSLGVANFFFIYGNRFSKRMASTAFAFFMTFTSISSGPVIAAGLQLLMIGWDRTLQFLKARWGVLTVLGILALGAMRVASEFDFMNLLLQNLMFDPQTAEGRFVILEYGMASVMRDPIFGIGAGDWVRPYWKHATLDNFWLLMTMRYGIPCLLLLVLAIGFSCARIMARSGLSEEAARYRTGYLIALAGLVVVLATVYVWGGTFIFIMAYLGAGAWFYTPEEPQPAALADPAGPEARMQRRRGLVTGSPEGEADAARAPTLETPAGGQRGKPGEGDRPPTGRRGVRRRFRP